MSQPIDRSGGVAVCRPGEVWMPTMNLGFMILEEKKILHQQWQSNIGRVLWRQIPEIDPRMDPY